MLSDNQYNTLAPFADLIKLAADSDVIASTTPWETIVAIHTQRGGAPLCGFCRGEVLGAYKDYARLIREYEAHGI